MKKKSLLVTGASGLLGNKIVAMGQQEYSVIPTDISEPLHPNAVRADITDIAEVKHLFEKSRPEIAIHTASETNVDKCETEKEHAWKVNVLGTHNIAVACRDFDAKLVYISTDYVFKGEKGMYNEEDHPNPINYYGCTKMEGEELVMRYCSDYAILRTSVLYGRHPYKQDFAAWVINKLEQNKEIMVVSDHINTPTFADNLVEMTLEVAEKDLEGLYHASGSERISRFKFAEKIAEVFSLNSDLIKPITMEELKTWVAERPKDSSLNTEKIRTQLNAKPMKIMEGLEKLKMEMEA